MVRNLSDDRITVSACLHMETFADRWAPVGKAHILLATQAE